MILPIWFANSFNSIACIPIVEYDIYSPRVGRVVEFRKLFGREIAIPTMLLDWQAGTHLPQGGTNIM